MIRQTAASQRLLLALIMGCNLLLALSEVFTLTVIYAAVNLLNADADLQHFR
jgi:hypothetical protein